MSTSVSILNLRFPCVKGFVKCGLRFSGATPIVTYQVASVDEFATHVYIATVSGNETRGMYWRQFIRFKEEGQNGSCS